MNSIWREIRNNFYDEEEHAFYIDAWKTYSNNEEGKVIAKVYDDKTIEYCDERAKTDSYAQAVINETLLQIDLLEDKHLDNTRECTVEKSKASVDNLIAKATAESREAIHDNQLDYDEQKTSVTLSNKDWTRLKTFLLMTTKHREGELDAWKKLSHERNGDGTLAFPNAEGQVAFWEETIAQVEKVLGAIDEAQGVKVRDSGRELE